ncbi:hypothetical protein HAT86_06915 [Roseovarius gahaiensis]|uniref:Uncharacterized protein n=1 Tax=Roseovarius gahaiensis TaxID=2716691 RepID=A0A967EG52_9RHOB|nr:hypothetical protein [Roseovarius gahaiensis]NHQ74195.1 hypothetical protein [Roseovarius gahaiensis]
MTHRIVTTPDGTRWFVASHPDGTTKRERIDPNLFPEPQPKPDEPQIDF